MDEAQAVAAGIQAGGPILMFVIFIAGFRLKWWVWGDHMADMREDRDYWRKVGTRGTAIAERSVERLVGHHTIQQVLDQAEDEARAAGRKPTIRDIERIADERRL